MTEPPIPLLVISPPQQDAIDRAVGQIWYHRYCEALTIILGRQTVRELMSPELTWFRTEIGGCDVGGVWELPFGAEREEQRLR